MISCTFAEFYEACRDRLTEIQLRELDVKAEYFQLQKGYCGLKIEEEGMWISIFVGGILDAWELRRIITVSGTPKVGFMCRLGSPTYAIARYYRAKIEDSGLKYLDGAPVMRCLIDTQQTQRLQKNKVTSQALS